VDRGNVSSGPHDHQIERWSGLFATFYSLVWRNPASNRAVVEHAGVGPGDRVLDIGSGPGAALQHAIGLGADVYGVDPTPSMVTKASRRVPNATIREGSAEALPFDDGVFSHVWTISAFHHWASPGTGIDEVRRVLASGGAFLIVERKLKPGKDGHGFDLAQARDVSEQLADHGFHDPAVETINARRAEYFVVSGRV